jgi:hypothetical protein
MAACQVGQYRYKDGQKITAMKTTNCLTTVCRFCRYYRPEGRRGGTCAQLGVPVQAYWKACALAVSPFATAWQDIDEVVGWDSPLTFKYPEKHLSTIDNSPSIVVAEKQTVESFS